MGTTYHWVEGIPDEPVEDKGEGMTQTRGAEVEGGDKYRITLEVQQDLFNDFDPDLEPVAKHGRPLLILIGKHARLSNIDDNGLFIRTEAFESCGVPVLRTAGTSARGLLKSWVELRKTVTKETCWMSVKHGCRFVFNNLSNV